MKKQKVAVIGAGISGLTVAQLLKINTTLQYMKKMISLAA